ncbi:hypothetical protein NDU88_006330 [Pleurodeles waltl]|uniref:Uncharacterized protein n=1 Tax=Pleurodeles waltl TaxID=8319 RepID=A0AAV7WEH5_PLEWA|nr:hypothetical protein NDU88_006330 [Pleurodeles waltl]
MPTNMTQPRLEGTWRTANALAVNLSSGERRQTTRDLRRETDLAVSVQESCGGTLATPASASEPPRRGGKDWRDGATVRFWGGILGGILLAHCLALLSFQRSGKPLEAL